jgi:hypothetical protein
MRARVARSIDTSAHRSTYKARRSSDIANRRPEMTSRLALVAAITLARHSHHLPAVSFLKRPRDIASHGSHVASRQSDSARMARVRHAAVPPTTSYRTHAPTVTGTRQAAKPQTKIVHTSPRHSV